MNLTLEDIRRAFELLPKTRRILGCAVNPSDAVRIKDEGGGVPLLVDCRMEHGQAQVYYDLDAWRERCWEQNKWDASRFPGEK